MEQGLQLRFVQILGEVLTEVADDFDGLVVGERGETDPLEKSRQIPSVNIVTSGAKKGLGTSRGFPFHSYRRTS